VTTRDHGQSYQMMVGALAEATRRRNDELGGAEQAYQESAAQAAGELARAEADAQAADRWAGTAAAQVVDVDRDAARLWDELRQAPGLRVRSLGELPEPIPIEMTPRIALTTGPGATLHEPQSAPRVLLAQAAERIDGTIRPAKRPLPRWALPLLPVVGALAATMTALVGAGIVTFSDAGLWGATVIRWAGWLTFLVAPSAGVPIATLAAHHRLHARLDIGGVGLTLIGGMIAAALTALAFAARH
jgi:hypothetical protein